MPATVRQADSRIKPIAACHTSAAPFATVVDVTKQLGEPGIRVSFMRDTPAMFQHALARRFIGADVPVEYVDGARGATKAVGDDVGVILTFLVVSAIGGVTYDAERELLRRAVRVLQAILSEVPFRAEIRLQEPVAVTEYILPSGHESSRALDAYLVDQEAGRWRGGRLRWSPEQGWVNAETANTPDAFVATANRLGSLTREQQAEWIAEQLRIRREHDARVAWAIRMLQDDEQRRAE